MTSAPDLSTLDADELRQLASRLLEEMRGKQALIDKLTHEMAILKRLKFAASSEALIVLCHKKTPLASKHLPYPRASSRAGRAPMQRHVP